MFLSVRTSVPSQATDIVQVVTGVHYTSKESPAQLFFPLVKGEYSKGAEELGVCLTWIGHPQCPSPDWLQSVRLGFCESCAAPGAHAL